MTSNIAQNYPYTSESETDRRAAVEAALERQDGLRDQVRAESTPLGDDDLWWVWKCTAPGCPGFLHAAGYARDSHAVYVVCDANGHTFLR